MTPAMWFAWLLRTDIRAGQPIADAMAQKDFVSWWLLFGQKEYPAVWWCCAAQVRVAMECALVIGTVPIPRLVHRIWLSRGDLQHAYPPHGEEDAADLLCWYRLHAAAEYAAAPPLPSGVCRATERPSRRVPWNAGNVPRIAVALWERSATLQRLVDPADPDARTRLAAWYGLYGARLLPATRGLPARPVSECVEDCGKACLPNAKGVNLIGCARAESGIGEDVRAMSRALDAAGVAHVIVDVGTPHGIRGADHSRDCRLSDRLVYATTVFCMTAFDTCAAFLAHGAALFGARHNIGYWPWELPIFPRPCVEATRLVTQIWAATRFQQAAYVATCRIPVRHVPPAVDVSCVGKPSRRRRGGRYVFIYPFDPNSYLARKNPIAAIRAFRAAFARHDGTVSLVLRVNGEPPRSPAWRAVLRACGGDRRIRILTGTRDRSAALALLADADCLISPHRAEGFGRNIAEAIALGTPVIATCFSGSDDYLRGAERLLSRRRAVRQDEYPFADGQTWAEPDVRDLARRMIRRRAKPGTRFARRRRAAALLHEHGPAATGERLRACLAEVQRATPHPVIDANSG